MIWLDILKIVGKVVGAFTLVCFMLGTILHGKHEIFANALAGSAIVLIGYGFVSLFMFVFFGK
jgi:hypothetical protein